MIELDHGRRLARRRCGLPAALGEQRDQR